MLPHEPGIVNQVTDLTQSSTLAAIVNLGERLNDVTYAMVDTCGNGSKKQNILTCARCPTYLANTPIMSNKSNLSYISVMIS